MNKRDMMRAIKPLEKIGCFFYPKRKTTLPLILEGTSMPLAQNHVEKKGSAQIKSLILLSAISTPGITTIEEKKISRNHSEIILKKIAASISINKIKKGNLKDYEWQQLLHKTDQLNNAKIFIDDTPALSILELRAKSRRLKSQHDIQCIIVDYLQLMTGEYGKSSGNREQEIASISRSLKAIAKELNIPVLALSQLSRAVETRGGDKRPVLSDLRESGSIEQDADMVIFIYRADRYDINEDEDGNLTAGVAEILLRKNRNGPTGKVKLKFIERFAKFADMSTLDDNEVKKYQSKANNGFDSNKKDPF